MPSDQTPPPSDAMSSDLSHAGAIVDQAIGHMIKQNINGQAIASALLGGAMGVLVRGMDDDGVIRILERAIAGIRSGDMRRMNP